MSRLLTVKEVAERLRVHPMTVRRHIKSGRLRSTHIGRAVRIPEEAVETLAGREHGREGQEMSKEEWIARLLEPPTPEEWERRRKAFEEMPKLAVKVDFPVDALVRAARRGREITGGEKTWEELIAEESEPLGD